MNEIHLEIVDSTNTYAKKNAHTFPKHQITCITAEEQTAGRGRYQRGWVSPPGVNIYATFYFTLPSSAPHLTSLAQLMAYSFAKVLLQEGFKPKIKWPNDLQLSGKKVSGILCETQFSNDLVEIFLGIGINVNLELEEAVKIDQPATSLKIETGEKWDRKVLLKKLQKEFEKDLTLFKKEGFPPFSKAFEELLALKGEQVKFFDGEREWDGIFHSITKEGHLNLLLSDQTICTLRSGDLRES